MRSGEACTDAPSPPRPRAQVGRAVGVLRNMGNAINDELDEQDR